MTIDWDAQPVHLTLDDIVRLTGESKLTAYGELARGLYPIAPIARKWLGCRYKFTRANVRAWIEDGEITNPRHPSKQRALRRIG